MKGFKKLALVAAIAAAPFAQAELTAIDDAAMGEMTGQAGISIELSAQVSIGGIEYTDTDGFAPSSAAGTLAISNVVLGGNGGGALDGIKIDIDVDDNAGLVIHLGATNTQEVLSGGAGKVDFGLAVGDVTLQGNGSNAVLASGISIGGNLGPIDVVIGNDGTIDVDAYFEVTSGSLDLDVLGLGITNLTIGDDNSPITTGVYAASLTAVQAGVLAGTQDATGNGFVAANGAAITTAGDDAVTGMTDADVDGVDDVTGLTTAQTRTAGEDAATTGFYNAGVASVDVAATNASTIAGVSNMAYVGMTIATTTTGYQDTSTLQPVVVTDALNITIDAMNMDIAMDVTLGADSSNPTASLGHVAINDLNLSGTSLTIYGH